MSTDEQRARTVCGWIGVEISKSRVRTPGKAGFGLYRVRGSIGFLNTYNPSRGQTYGYAVGEWTAYAFTLRAILAAAEVAIKCGRPSGPAMMRIAGQMDSWPVTAAVPTRWTSAYQGRRDLGVRVAVLGEIVERSTVRSRQRADNARFHEEHQRRRAHGLGKRHAAKLRRNAADRDQ